MHVLVVIVLIVVLCYGRARTVEYNRTAEGYPVGYIPDCKGSNKPVAIPTGLLKQLSFIIDSRTDTGRIYRKRFTYFAAAKGIVNNPNIDFKTKPTVVFISGFMDFADSPSSRVMAGVYNKLNYNVILVDTNRFTTYIYSVVSRLSRDVGRRVAEVLADMTRHGFDPKRTELVGLSLGAHVIGYISKTYRKLTGVNIHKIVGLDPAGPCFKYLPSDDRLKASDADNVLVIHTNIDGFGLATPLGHVDFYVNGGEYQPSTFSMIPCLTFCSHVRSYLIWLIALEHPKSFIGMRCDTIQQARDGKCYDIRPQITNTLGPNTNFNNTGIFYLTTDNEYPYFLGKKGLQSEYEVWSSHYGTNGDVVSW